jgi:phospholipid/cholesterol/gamma-HCH transport system substrate-binding protein
MTARRRNDFMVGAVIILATIAVVVGTLWVKQTDIAGRRSHVSARFRDVGGVQLGTPVVIRGVRAGRVDRMELKDDGWVHVRLVLDEKTKLPTDPVVLLNESSLFGEWEATIVERSGIPADREVRRQIAEAGRVDSVLPGATLPDIAKLAASAGRIAGDVARVAERVEVAFDEAAARELRASIHNVADVSSQLAATVRSQSQNLDAVGRDLRAGVRSVRGAAASVEEVAGRIDSSTASGQLRRIVDDMATAAGQLREVTSRVSAMTSRLDRSQAQLDLVMSRTDSVLAKINEGKGSIGLLVNDASLYRNSDSLVSDLRKLLADFQANPRKYVRLKVF